MQGSRWPRWTAILALSNICSAASPVLTPSNVTQYQHVASASLVDLALSHNASSSKSSTSIQPLSSDAVEHLQLNGLSDHFYHVTENNYDNLTAQSIAYISCDPSDHPGLITAETTFKAALSVPVTAVILYSLKADYCNISPTDSSYPYIYSMMSARSSQALLDQMHGASANMPVHGWIAFADKVGAYGPTSARIISRSMSTSSNSSFSASSTTAVAMICLYSVTGVITFSFLVIIVTGAIRAHRHPERYGPRNVSGRPRQSRVRGLARAMLDTIPIVQFGEREQAKQSDTELEAQTSHVPAEPNLEQVAVVSARKSHEGEKKLDASADVVEPRNSLEYVDSGIAPAVTNTSDAISADHDRDDAPGCSICKEDFAIGQDLRVLPCDHKFHPACIDPWLLNVSGTCPLCRINLHSHDSDNSQPDDDEMPLPIDTGRRPYQKITMRQSFLIGLGLERVHTATREERLTAVRRVRDQQREGGAEHNEAVADLAGEERTRRQRVMSRFGIRTRRG